MPIDPSFLPPAAAPDTPPTESRLPVATMDAAPLPAATPNLVHTVLFAAFVMLAGILIGVAFALALKHIGPHVRETTEQMQTDPRIVIPVEAVVYAIAAGASVLLFPLMWGRSFGQGVHWRSFVVRQRWWLLVAIGIVTSVTVQLLSNFLPIPKELPIDKFFTNPVGVWLVAIFGVTVAPAFEELAFRGFLLPSLASAWDWVALRADRSRRQIAGNPHHQVSEGEWQQQAAAYASLPPADTSVFHRPSAELATGSAASGPSYPDPRWSTPALIFATVVTSIGFALLHSDQLAHSLAPLGVLFVVSVVLCLTRLRFQSLAASTLVHSMYNATIFAMLFVGTDGFRHLDKLGK